MSVGTSRWVTMQPRWLWMYSMGSSIVMMWPERSRLMRSMMQASVVDLPEPAGPVTSTRPFCRPAVRRTASGMLKSLGSGRPNGITRMTADSEPRWRNTLARKRPMPGSAKEKSSSWLSSTRKRSTERPATS